MACSGGLTGLIMASAGSFVTNGALPGTFGSAPLSSLSGAALSITDAATGLTLAPTLATTVSSITSITSQSWAGSLNNTLSSMASGGFSDAMTSAWNALPDELGSGALFDAIGGFAPGVNSVLTAASGGANVLNNALSHATTWAGQTIGGAGSLVGGVLSGDPKKFGTILSSAQSYVASANTMINAANNSGVLGNTFTGLDNIVSGGLSDVNLDFGGFGAELAKVGGAINLSNIDGLGSPGQMLANMSEVGTLGPMYSKIANISIDSRVAQSIGADLSNLPTGNVTIGELGIDINTIAKVGANLPPALQSEIYREFEFLDETEIGQVKSILGTTQDAIATGADLFDPTKLFPESHRTFTAPLKTASLGYRAVFDPDSGAVNEEFNDLGRNLEGILPNNLAVSNGAIARSLQQIKGIQNSNNTDLASTLTELETLKDLDQVQNQSSYVTDSVKTYWNTTFGVDDTTGIDLATGPGGTMKLSDIIGFSAGYNSAAPLTQNVSLFQQLQDNGDLDPLTNATGVYSTIQKFSNGDFGPTTPGVSFTWEVVIPSGYVGEGTYGSNVSSAEAYETAWINGIIPAVKIILNLFSSNDTAQLVVRNSTRVSQQLAREYQNQTAIDNQDLTAVRASTDVAVNFATNLPAFALDTDEGGSAELLERIANFDSLGGQSMVATMREARNLQKLANANIQQDAALSTTTVPNPGTLTTNTYTQEEAKAQLVK